MKKTHTTPKMTKTSSSSPGIEARLDSKDRISWTLAIKFEMPVDDMTVAGTIGTFAERMINEAMSAKVKEEMAFMQYMKDEGIYDDYLAKFKSTRVQTLQG